MVLLCCRQIPRNSYLVNGEITRTGHLATPILPFNLSPWTLRFLLEPILHPQARNLVKMFYISADYC